jgi:hypothetical protein
MEQISEVEEKPFTSSLNIHPELLVWEKGGVIPTPQSRQSAKLFLQSLELGLPQPLTRPLVLGGGAHSLAKEGTTVQCDTLYMYVLCGLPPHPITPLIRRYFILRRHKHFSPPRSSFIQSSCSATPYFFKIN